MVNSNSIFRNYEIRINYANFDIFKCFHGISRVRKPINTKNLQEMPFFRPFDECLRTSHTYANFVDNLRLYDGFE